MVVAGLALIGMATAVLLRAYVTGQLQRPARRTRSRHDDRPRGDAGMSTPVEVDHPSLRPWTERGIDARDASRWLACGFDADHAYLLASMGVDVDTASTLRAAGLEHDSLITLVELALFEHHAPYDDLAAAVARAGDLAPETVGWMARGLDAARALAYARSGISPEGADEWSARGWNVDEALPWYAARFEPESASAWRASGFDAASAHAWRSEHFGIRQAIAWRRLGDRPDAARAVERRLADAGVTVAEALRWLDRGHSVDEICAGLPVLAATDSAPPLADRFANTFDAVPLSRDDLLSAAGHLARAGGDPEILRRVQRAAGAAGESTEVSADLVETLLGELHRLDAAGALGAPHAARALARRLDEGLVASALVTGRRPHVETGHAIN